MSTTTTTPNLGARHTELLQAVVKNMSPAVNSQIDWAAVAEDVNCKTPKYARDQWAIIRQKLGCAPTAKDGEATPKKKAAPKRKAAGENGGAKKKGKKAADEGAGDDTEAKDVKPEPESEEELV